MLVGFLLSVPVDIESKKKETRQEEASRAPLVLTQPQTLIVPVRKTAKSNDLLSVNCQDKIIIYAYINLDLLLIKNFQKRIFPTKFRNKPCSIVNGKCHLICKA